MGGFGKIEFSGIGLLIINRNTTIIFEICLVWQPIIRKKSTQSLPKNNRYIILLSHNYSALRL